MTQTTAPVRSERIEDVIVLTLDDPEKMNPLSEPMRDALHDLLDQAMNDTEARAVIITGAGGNFTSGGDLTQLMGDEAPDPARSRRRLVPLHRIVELVAGGPKPVIAAVEGCAFGAGLSIAAACDFAILGEGARLSAAFGKVGLTADTGLVWSLPQRVGRTVARDMMFTARSIKAKEAVEIGLGDQLVEAGGALAAALAKAAEYRVVAPLMIAAVKAAFVEGPGSLAAALALERQQQPLMRMTSDHAEGLAAFREKRSARFTGR